MQSRMIAFMCTVAWRNPSSYLILGQVHTADVIGPGRIGVRIDEPGTVRLTLTIGMTLNKY